MEVGAEAVIKPSLFLNKLVVCKQRVRKRYRVQYLDDKINKHRLLLEARCLARCRSHSVNVPNLYFVDLVNKSLYLEFISGKTLKELIEVNGVSDCLHLVALLGTQVSRMHTAGIIHGDLTSSNVLVAENVVYLIDFGLGQLKSTIEDKAVDLLVLEKALTSAHKGSEDLIAAFFSTYSQGENAQVVMKKLDSVRLRGRKRSMIG